MSKLFLTLHVVAAILLIGPVTVAASLFPRYARGALGAWPEADPADVGVAGAMHRITRVYGALAIVVPLLGLYTAVTIDVLGDVWVLASLALTIAAAAMLVLAVLPRQSALMQALRGDAADGPTDGAATNEATAAAVRATRRLAMFTGMFATLWVIVVVLMIVRPGSTTGA